MRTDISAAIRTAGVAFVLGLIALTQPTLADHIEGHNNSDPIWPVPLPGREHFNGGAAFVTAIGPIGGMEISNTEFDITYVSDGATPASEIAIDVGYLTEAGYVEFHLTGADLGFGSGPGTFHGVLSTDELNGIAVESFLFPPYSQINIALGALNGGIEGEGYFEDSFINFQVGDLTTPGDLNCDGEINAFDIEPFLLALFEPDNYAKQYPDCDINNADTNDDGSIDAFDIESFLGLLFP